MKSIQAVEVLVTFKTKNEEIVCETRLKHSGQQSRDGCLNLQVKKMEREVACEIRVTVK